MSNFTKHSRKHEQTCFLFFSEFQRISVTSFLGLISRAKSSVLNSTNLQGRLKQNFFHYGLPIPK